MLHFLLFSVGFVSLSDQWSQEVHSPPRRLLENNKILPIKPVQTYNPKRMTSRRENYIGLGRFPSVGDDLFTLFASYSLKNSGFQLLQYLDRVFGTSSTNQKEAAGRMSKLKKQSCFVYTANNISVLDLGWEIFYTNKTQECVFVAHFSVLLTYIADSSNNARDLRGN